MKKNLLTAIWMTLATTALLGVLYPLAITGLARLIFPRQANGGLIQARRRNNRVEFDRAGIFFAGIFSLASLGGRCSRL